MSDGKWSFKYLLLLFQPCFGKSKKLKSKTNTSELDPDVSTNGNAILYGIDDSPPWILALFLALQVYFDYLFKKLLFKLQIPM